MSKTGFSPQSIALRKRGPFPGRVDPWAETGRYFHQLHAGIIGHLLEQIQDPLEQLGYVAGRETSLQISEATRPDLFVRQRPEAPERPVTKWDYKAAAEGIMVEPGIAVDWDVEDLHALAVVHLGSGQLVAIVEVISPRNKTERSLIEEYRQRRERLLRQGVNVVEIDLTRSVKRLLDEIVVTGYAYHAAVYLPGELPRLIGVDYGQPLKKIALPLRGEVLAMDLQAAYDQAYAVNRIAIQIESDDRYHETFLPFATLLDGDQRAAALAAVAAWRAEMARLDQA